MIRFLACVPFVVASLLYSVSAAAELKAADVLADMGFPSSAEKTILSGKFVKADVEGSNERELAVAMAFLVKLPPQELIEKLQGDLLLDVDPDAIAHVRIQAGLADFAKLTLSPDGKNQTGLYRDAEPGDDLNLSTEEIAAFQALKGKPDSAVEDQVRKQLLGRYEAYRKKGLGGIAPYARDGDPTDPAADLKSAIEASSGIQKYAPNFYKVLAGYPDAPAPGFEEGFNWVSYRAHGTPVFILTHGFSMQDGDVIAVCQRQFYVSASYNVEQAVAGFLPVKEGTVVLYVNRTSTDQVTGFGGSAKRSIGSKLLASQLEGLFTSLQKAAAE